MNEAHLAAEKVGFDWKKLHRVTENGIITEREQNIKRRE